VFEQLRVVSMVVLSGRGMFQPPNAEKVETFHFFE